MSEEKKSFLSQSTLSILKDLWINILILALLFFFAKEMFLVTLRNDFISLNNKVFQRTQYEDITIENNITIVDKKWEEIAKETEKIELSNDDDWLIKDFNQVIIGDRTITAVKQLYDGHISNTNLTYKEKDWITYFFTHSNDWGEYSHFLGDFLYNNLADNGDQIKKITIQDILGNKQEYRIIETKNSGKNNDFNMKVQKTDIILYTCVPWQNGEQQKVWLLRPTENL